jgi:hypothetical protein
MTSSFVSAPPANEFADAITRRFPPHVLHQAADARSSGFPRVCEKCGLELCPGGAPFQDKRTKQGLIAKVRFNELRNLVVL